MQDKCTDHRIAHRRLLAGVMLVLSFTINASAQTTAFTYQGKLNESGNLANDQYDFQFTLFDTATVGTAFETVSIPGNLKVTGSKNFRIDHPLDPENRYLYHAAIESAEVLNLYTGNVITDKKGQAIVTLPDWFEAINQDFRYQLTVIGQFAQAIVASEIRHHRFSIKTNKPQVKVSWQVVGVRSDAGLRSHPFKLEEDKPAGERGRYLNPEGFGQPRERSVEWPDRPERSERPKQPRDAAQPARNQRQQ